MALVGTLMVVGQASVSAAPINLSSWEQRGPTANGNWVVSPDGSSVLQTINGNPTYFVSPTNQSNTTIRGTLRVGTTGDDDLIGFVLGFNAPVTTGNDSDFLLFDWKQTNQGNSFEGFALSRVNGTFLPADYDPVFWERIDRPGFDNLANDYGTTRGWKTTSPTPSRSCTRPIA